MCNNAIVVAKYTSGALVRFDNYYENAKNKIKIYPDMGIFDYKRNIMFDNVGFVADKLGITRKKAAKRLATDFNISNMKIDGQCF